jgi:hypothetical protein
MVQPMVPRHCLSLDAVNHHGKRKTKSTARRAGNQKGLNNEWTQIDTNDSPSAIERLDSPVAQTTKQPQINADEHRLPSGAFVFIRVNPWFIMTAQPFARGT